MKKIEIFGKKVPVIAILIALLVIGTASAALFYNYATLEGTVKVTNDISVTDSDLVTFHIGDEGTGNLTFESPAKFTINNAGDEPVIVKLVTSLFFENNELTTEEELEGLYLYYSVIEDGEDIESGPVLVPPGGLMVDVEFETADNAFPGNYTIQVAIDFYEGGASFNDPSVNNYMQTISLAQKVASDWSLVPDGNTATINYIPMGNEFYYELIAIDIPVNEYCLIYYADKEEPRDENWGGDNPGAVIATVSTDGNGDIAISGIKSLNMDLPHADDWNSFFYEYDIEPDNYLNKHGAKLWLVPSSHINENYVSDETQLVTAWAPGLILFEEELIHYIDTDL